MNRRRFVAVLAALAAAPAYGHTPYRQWKVLRQRYLLVHSTRTDPRSDALAELAVATLARELPEAKPMVARARRLERLASLLTTGQAVLGVMRARDATDLFRSRGALAAFDGRDLRCLLAVDAHVLATVASFPEHHAWLVTAALVEHAHELQWRVPVNDAPVPVHPGALAYMRGEAPETTGGRVQQERRVATLKMTRARWRAS